VNIELRVTGLEDIEAKLRALPEKALQAGTAELFQATEDIIGDSKENYVPVDLGPLRASGHVQLPERQGDSVTVRAGFGGAAAPYALAVHEHLSPSSPPSWRKAEASGRPVQFSPTGYGPKFLERPLLAAAPKLAQRIADAIRSVFA
jgi:hypothetical protein